MSFECVIEEYGFVVFVICGEDGSFEVGFVEFKVIDVDLIVCDDCCVVFVIVDNCDFEVRILFVVEFLLVSVVDICIVKDDVKFKFDFVDCDVVCCFVYCVGCDVVCCLVGFVEYWFIVVYCVDCDIVCCFVNCVDCDVDVCLDIFVIFDVLNFEKKYCDCFKCRLRLLKF